MLVLLAAMGWGIREGWRAYESRPKPATVAVRLSEPGITPLGDKLVPNPLRLTFAKSVAPLAKVGKESFLRRKAGAGLAGQVEMGGRQDVWSLSRAEDWPAATKFRVAIERTALAPLVLLEKYRLPWSTPGFTAKVRKLEFYQDPTDPAGQAGGGHVGFLPPCGSCEPAEGGDVYQGRQQGSSALRCAFRHAPAGGLVAHQAAHLPEREEFMKFVVNPGLPHGAGRGGDGKGGRGQGARSRHLQLFPHRRRADRHRDER